MLTEENLTDESAMEEAPKPAPISGDTLELLRAIMHEQSDANRETIATVIAELRKPDAATQEKMDAERRRMMELTRARVENTRRQQESMEQVQATCRHAMPNGRTRLVGSVLSNGYAQAFCPECHWLSKPFQALPHELTAPIDIPSWANAYAVVQSRVAQSPPPPPIAPLQFGSRIDF